MYVVIVGCGRIGRHLAQNLARGNANVVLVDKVPRALSLLSGWFNGVTVHGDGLDVEVLEKAGLRNADALFVLTGSDNANLVIAQIAKKMFQVGKVVIQLADISKQKIIEGSGIVAINRGELFLEEFKKCI